MRVSSRIIAAVAAGLCWVALVSAEPALRNAIVAIVNDKVITLHELRNFTGPAVDLLTRTFKPGSETFRERYGAAIKDGVNQLIQRQLILEDFKSAGGVLNEGFIDDEIKDRIRRQYGDRATLTQTLKKQRISFESYRQKAREEIIISFMKARNVSSSVIISPAKMERYYTNHLDQYRVEDQVKLSMIVLNNPSESKASEIAWLALEIAAKIEEGTGFAEMAAVYSEGSTRQEGGDWGWRERTKLNAGLSEIAFNLESGQLSGVLALAREQNDDYWIYQYDEGGLIKKARKYTSKDEFLEERLKADANGMEGDLPSPREFYIMVVAGKREARTRPLDEVREEIEKELTVEERNRLQKKWIDRLADKSFIARF